MAEWLSVVPECRINSSTKQVSESISSIQLANDEELVSFDVSSLYTNVPLMESIEVCTDLLFRETINSSSIDKITFVDLAMIDPAK